MVIDRNLLAARLIKELRLGLELFEQEGLAPYLPRWEKLDNFIHRPVKLIIGDKEIYAFRVALTPRAHYCWSRMV